MIERSRDPARVNALIGRDFEGVDFAEILSEPLHICLLDGESGAIFMFRGPGVFEVHVFFAARGREALNLGHAMLNHMREHFGGRLFWALVPVESRKVATFTRRMGWKSLGVRETANGANELFATGGC